MHGSALSVGDLLTWNWWAVRALPEAPIQLTVPPAIRTRLLHHYEWLTRQLNHRTIYGLNTGFGQLCHVRIAPNHLTQLQENLIRTHAVGSGSPLPPHLARLVLLLKILEIAQGWTCASPHLLDTLTALYNSELIPYIPQEGSLGASGDLAPLAHLALILLGEGWLLYEGQRLPLQDARQRLSPTLRTLPLPYRFGPGEGLAILNGRQFSLALLMEGCRQAWLLWLHALFLGTLSLHILNGNDAFLDETGYQPTTTHFPWVRTTAHLMRQIKERLIQWCASAESEPPVQEPYSYRCMPQILGCAATALAQAEQIIQQSLNSAHSNPLIFPQEEKVFMGGHFHAIFEAWGADLLRWAILWVVRLSERHIAHWMDGRPPLPPFLAGQPGLESGAMLVHYYSASVLADAVLRQMPVSVADSIVSGKQEDVNSHAPAALRQTLQLIQDGQRALAAEWAVLLRAIRMRDLSVQMPRLLEPIARLLPQVPAGEGVWSALIQQLIQAVSTVQDQLWQEWQTLALHSPSHYNLEQILQHLTAQLAEPPLV